MQHVEDPWGTVVIARLVKKKKEKEITASLVLHVPK
jgi:hypothetical protein